MLCYDCSNIECPLHAGGEVLDPEVEVDHHQLFSLYGRPGRSDVVRLPLELDLLLAIGRRERPGGGVSLYTPESPEEGLCRRWLSTPIGTS